MNLKVMKILPRRLIFWMLPWDGRLRLTRPIDAIRHQAKTVTVGTSRKEKELKE